MLNKALLLFLFSIFHSLTLASPTQEDAGKKPSKTHAHRFINIAVVDVQTILELSTAVGNIRSSVEKISLELQNEFSHKEQELKKIESELIEKQKTLAQDQFDKEVLNFNQQVTETQKKAQEKKIKLEQYHSKAISKVNEVAMQIIRDIAQENNLNIVLPSTQVLYADETLNITEKVLLKLNKAISYVEIKF